MSFAPLNPILPIRITREQQVEESVNLLVRAALTERGFPGESWEMVDSYPYGLEKLDNNLIACGFTFDDGGKQFEIGSNMKERKYTIEFFIFAKTNTLGKNFANAIKFTIENDEAIPLYDVTQQPPQATGEWMALDSVHARRQPVPDPEPWQEFTWYVCCTVTDWYTPALT